jgi:capsular exopolysaccharide synthesis family protein
MGPSLLESVWRFRRLVIITVLAAAAAGFILSFLQSTMYEGSTLLILSDPRNSGVFRDTNSLVIDPSRYVRNQAERMVSTPVLTKAAELEGGRISIEDLRKRVTAQPSTNLDLITIKALDPTAGGAAALADSVGHAYEAVVAEDVRANADAALAELDRSRSDLQVQIDVLEAELVVNPADATAKAERDAAVAQLVNLKNRAEQISVDAALYGSGVELFEASEIPESPATPKPLRNGAVAGILGLLAAGAYAWWRAEHTQSADTRHDAAPVLGAPLLGEIPEFAVAGTNGTTPALSEPGSTAAEAYQFVVASLGFALQEAPGAMVVITSADQGDGKTITALNLAAAAAKDGRRVLLVDADERLRGLTRYSGGAPSPGLTDLVTGKASLAACTRLWPAPNGLKLPMVPAGTSLDDTAGFFRTPAFRTAMLEVRTGADMVLVDTPPMLAVSDASAIAAQADGIVLIVRKGTPLRHLEEVRNRLEFFGAPLLGYVFNRSDPDGGRYGYKYRYRYKYSYGYGYTSQNGESKHRRERQRR